MDDYEKSFITPDYSNQMLYKMSDMWRNDKFCDAILQAGKTEMKVLLTIYQMDYYLICNINSS